MGCGDPQPAEQIKPASITVGMAVFEEHALAEMTIESLRLGHGIVGQTMQIIVVDNKPHSAGSGAFREFCSRARCEYVALPSPVGTAAPRDEIFRRSTSDVTCVIDPHVILPWGSIHNLSIYAAKNPGDYNLWHGVLFEDDARTIVATHLEPEWGTDLMKARWAKINREDLRGGPKEIPMHGLGMLACRTEAWLGAPAGLKGFTCDEWPIAEKFRAAGRKVLLLPGVTWWHRFRREKADGLAPYANTLEDRFAGYLRWYRHLGIDERELFDVFRPRLGSTVERIAAEVGDVERFDPSADWVQNPKPRPKQKPKRPSYAKMAINYAKACLAHAKAGFPKVDEKTYKQRLMICRGCPLLTENEECGLCGCPVKDKALWAEQQCEDSPPRWHALVRRTEATDDPNLCYHQRIECPQVTAAHTKNRTVENKTGMVVRIDHHHAITTQCYCKDCGTALEPAVVKIQFKPKER